MINNLFGVGNFHHRETDRRGLVESYAFETFLTPVFGCVGTEVIPALQDVLRRITETDFAFFFASMPFTKRLQHYSESRQASGEAAYFFNISSILTRSFVAP